MARRTPTWKSEEPPWAKAEREIADREVLKLLTEKALEGQTTAIIALERALRAKNREKSALAEERAPHGRVT